MSKGMRLPTLFTAFAVGWFTFSSSESPRADFLDAGFQTDCDEAGNRAEIVPYGTYDSDGSLQPPRDCTLASGRTIRIKLGRGPAYPYGMGGESRILA